MLIVYLLQPSFSIAQTCPLAAIFSSRRVIIRPDAIAARVSPIRNTIVVLVNLPDCEREMQLSSFEKRRITIWEKMREIEGELFLLSARSGESDFENGHRFNRMCGERTKLASELLLKRASFAVTAADLVPQMDDIMSLICKVE
jgi:hypothetical protein